MNKKAIPFAIATSAYDIPLSFYKENNIKHILFDLDNTLASYKEKVPSDKVKELIKKLKENGLSVAIASNNTSERVHNFAKELDIPAYCALRKPFAGPLKKVIEKEKFNRNETILIGDQILTDVYAGNKAGIRVILTKPLTPSDPPWTKINRILARGKMRQLYKEPYKSQWKEII